MEPKAALLLEVNQLSTGKRMAFCLLSGEFVLVTDDAALQFGAPSGLELVGQNLLMLVAPFDAEKIQDLVEQAHAGLTGYDGATQRQLQLATMARIASTNGMLWLRVLSVPMSLRLVRCIESLTEMRSLHRFADAASCVLSDDELVSTGSSRDVFSRHKTAGYGPSTSGGYGCSKVSDYTFAKYPGCGKANEDASDNDYDVDNDDDCGLFDMEDPLAHGPLELLSTRSKADAISAALPTAGFDLEPEEDTTTATPSLASYAFEADWMTDEDVKDEGFGALPPSLASIAPLELAI